MRKYDVMIASMRGWRDIAQEDGEWYGRSPEAEYRLLIPRYSTDVSTALDLLRTLPDWSIHRQDSGYIVEIAAISANLSTAIVCAYIAHGIREDLDIDHTSLTPEDKIRQREIRRIDDGA